MVLSLCFALGFVRFYVLLNSLDFEDIVFHLHLTDKAFFEVFFGFVISRNRSARLI